jgi:hypothetical protein
MPVEEAEAVLEAKDDTRLRDVLGAREIGVEGGKPGPGPGVLPQFEIGAGNFGVQMPPGGSWASGGLVKCPCLSLSGGIVAVRLPTR